MTALTLLTSNLATASSYDMWHLYQLTNYEWDR